MKPLVHDELLRRFADLIAERTGLQTWTRSRHSLREALAQRLKALKSPTPESYFQLLARGSDQAEWKQLVVLLTNQESYFFRDKSQFHLLEHTLLPELIEHNKGHRTLRLWSAGCSTGEEAYSLAILVDELLPAAARAREGWKVFILGTDISDAALDKARRGVYGAWSFRNVEARLKERYFHQAGDGAAKKHELEARIQRGVTFRHGNLLADGFPNKALEICDMDLILCRNVFIYFDHAAVSVVLRKMAAALRPGGYLMTGHTELHRQDLGILRASVFPETVVYQRPRGGHATHDHKPHGHKAGANRASAPPPKTPAPAQVAVASPSVFTAAPATLAVKTPAIKAAPATEPVQAHELLAEGKSLLHAGAHRAAIAKLEQLPAAARTHATLYLMAQAHANLGELSEAAELCQRAIKLDSFDAAPYYLLAHIAEEQGHHAEAARLLKKVVYLAPSFAPAYLDLAMLHEKNGEAERARRMRLAALQILEALPADTMIETGRGATAGQLSAQVRQQLKGR